MNVDMSLISHYRLNYCVSALLSFCTIRTLIVGSLFSFYIVV